MSIYKDHNGVTVDVITRLNDGTDVDGHYYQVTVGDIAINVIFQLGGVATVGVNGLTNEALLAILIHRTKVLNGRFHCDENDRAIQHMEEALVNFEVRTARRMVRGVEGHLKE